ncbi:hypothetical protein NL676_009559 [Syzygium grande]|nr:hypothetical protein NL676_009559 [Syzygium grande]
MHVAHEVTLLATQGLIAPYHSRLRPNWTEADLARYQFKRGCHAPYPPPNAASRHGDYGATLREAPADPRPYKDQTQAEARI